MRQFLYYLPKASGEGITRADVIALGITWLLDEGNEPVPRPVLNNGPDGGTGVLFARENGSHPHVIGYHRDRQTWERAPFGNYWVGYFNDAKPGPKSLALRDVLKGHEIRLHDGNKWLVPPTRLIGGILDVPMGLALNPEGALVQEPLAEYQQLTDDTQTIWTWQNSPLVGESANLLYTDMMQIAARALGRNYRVGLPEVNILRLLTTENIGAVCQAITDTPAYLEMMRSSDVAEKKTDPIEISG